MTRMLHPQRVYNHVSLQSTFAAFGNVHSSSLSHRRTADSLVFLPVSGLKRSLRSWVSTVHSGGAKSSSCPFLCLLQAVDCLQGPRASGSANQVSAEGSPWEWTQRWRLGGMQREPGHTGASPPRRKSLQSEAEREEINMSHIYLDVKTDYYKIIYHMWNLTEKGFHLTGTLWEEGIFGRKVAPLQEIMSFIWAGSGFTDFVTWISYP